jgi:hypothetical protein
MTWLAHRLKTGLALAFLVLLLTACPQESLDEARRETVDVPPGVEVETIDDPQSQEREVSFAGVLPGDFPKDLPIYKPASLIDFGSSGETSWVEMISPHAVARVRRELLGRLEADGYSSAAGSDGTLVISKGRSRVRLSVKDGRPGAVYRYEY